MLPRRQRLARQHDIHLALRSGRRISGKLLTIRHRPSPTNSSQVTVVVSRRTAKLATKRNQIKRRLREVLRGLLPTIPAQHIVVIVHPPATSATPSDMRDELTRLFQQIAK